MLLAETPDLSLSLSFFHSLSLSFSHSLSLFHSLALILSFILSHSLFILSLFLIRSPSLSLNSIQFNSIQGLYWHGKRVNIAKASEVDNIQSEYIK